MYVAAHVFGRHVDVQSLDPKTGLQRHSAPRTRRSRNQSERLLRHSSSSGGSRATTAPKARTCCIPNGPLVSVSPSYGNMQQTGGYHWCALFRSRQDHRSGTSMKTASLPHVRRCGASRTTNWQSEVGVRLMSSIQWSLATTTRTSKSRRAHNSAFVDDDGTTLHRVYPQPLLRHRRGCTRVNACAKLLAGTGRRLAGRRAPYEYTRHQRAADTKYGTRSTWPATTSS